MARWSQSLGSIRLALALLFSLVVLVFGCSQQVPASSRQSAPAPPPTGSVSAASITMSVQLPSAQLKAWSTQVATVTIVNESETATQIVTPILRLRVADSSGQAIFDSMPRTKSLPFPGFTRLAPQETWTQARRFSVPPPGSYVVEIEDLAAPPFSGPAHVPFQSVR